MNLISYKHTYNIFQLSYFVLFTTFPFLYSESLMDPVVVPRQAFLSVFLLWILGLLLVKSNNNTSTVKTSRLSFLLVTLSLLMVLSAFVSVSYAQVRSESLYVVSKYGSVFVFLLLTYFLLASKQLTKKDLTNGVLIFCTISLAYGAFDILSLWANGFSIFTHAFVINATYANKNLFASVLLLCLWAVLSAGFSRLLKMMFIVLMSLFILFLQSKIVLFVLIFFFVGLGIRNLDYFQKQKKSVTIAAFAVAGLVLLLSFNYQRFINLASFHTLDTRYALWKNSFEMFQEKPLGVGAGNWQVFFPKYGLQHFDLPSIRNGTTLGRQPHNDFIWILCELGAHGFAIYLSLFVLLFIMQGRTIRNNGDRSPYFLLLTTVGYCLIAFFDFPLERIEHQVLLSTIMAISMQSYDEVVDTGRSIQLRTFVVLAVLMIGFSIVICVYRLKGEYYSREAISVNRKKQPEQVIADCEKARSFFYELDPVGVPLDWYSGMALFYTGNTRAAEVKMEKALTIAPYNVHILKRLAAIYAKEGKRKEAIPLYRKLLRISPTASISLLK